jgi:hypothetical protein
MDTAVMLAEWLHRSGFTPETLFPFRPPSRRSRPL